MLHIPLHSVSCDETEYYIVERNYIIHTDA